MDQYIRVFTSGEILTANTVTDKDYPAIEICIDNRLVVVVEKAEPDGRFIAHVYADSTKDEPTHSIKLT